MVIEMSPLSASDRRDMLKAPNVEDGMAVGLFGGSFNPPHRGHIHVATIALQRLGLDQLWWMVSPGNPLKDHDGLPSLETRLALSRVLVRHPKIRVSGLERSLNTRYSADLVQKLARRYKTVRFVWVMGADNLTHFHRWDRWEIIAKTFPICIIDRPGDTLSTRSSRAARKFIKNRVDESDSQILKDMRAPAWTFLHTPRVPLSSTDLRNSAR